MWTVTSRQTQRLTTLAVGSGLFVFAVHLAFYFGQSHDHNTGPLWGLKRQSPSSLPVSPACRGYPSGDSDVVIVVKTGATEALARIPTLLTTFLSCVKENEVVFFSDMEQKIAGAHLHDALVDVVDEAKTVNADFELYELQKQLREYGGDVSSLPKAKEAWALDKYKNIHTAQKAWELHPNRTWYFFIDADTYVVWPSFFAWIKRLDPAKHLYLGRTIHTLNLFAHGGPGYLLSREAMRSLVGEDARKIASDFDISASTTCCGDAELAGSLSKKGVSLIDAYPLINHQKPREIQFGPKYWCPKYWCQPIITMHHVSPEEINNLWQFQQSRSNPELPLLFAELSTHVAPNFSPWRADWNNMPEDINDLHEIENGNTAEEWKTDPANSCRLACENMEYCFQYLWNGKSCKISSDFFSLGSKKEEEGGMKWVSGWNLEAVKKFQTENAECNGGLWEFDE